MEMVFRALSDPHRRELLDRLFERDGRTLADLDRHLPMTRFGTMKHLRVLEAAGLVVTRRAGREKLHYLNPVPIRLIHDRWIHKYAEPWVGALGELKRSLEAETMQTVGATKEKVMTAPRHVYEVYIRTTPERLWEAITKAEFTKDYYYGTLVKSEWKAGAPMSYEYPDGRVAAEGRVIEVVPPRKLVTMFSAMWDDNVRNDQPHRVTWTIEPMGETCKLTCEHSDFAGETATYQAVSGGLSVILNGLKTLLETGRPLSFGR
jgi:uncharacterized protein YndB with AHSA1/START domain